MNPSGYKHTLTVDGDVVVHLSTIERNPWAESGRLTQTEPLYTPSQILDAIGSRQTTKVIYEAMAGAKLTKAEAGALKLAVGAVLVALLS